ncbi:UNVERIFIED_CONTAM: hypothetical protein K2H54_059300 [Gekko kuhli]
MELMLADALLSRCPDSAALLGAVCAGGPGEALSVERTETLRFLLQRVAGGGWRGEDEARRLAWEAALGRCFPVLLGSGSTPAEGRLRLVRAACGALRCCASLCGPVLAERLAREALESLAAGPAGRLQPEAAVELLAAVAPWLAEATLLERTVGGALTLLQQEEDEDKTLLVAGRLLPALGRNSAALGRVWKGLVFPPESAPQPVSRTLLVLSALSEAVFPAGAQQPGSGADGEAPRPLDARLSSGFWKVVQRGLTESDALCRKRARYLLKRAVDVSEKLHAECTCSPDPGNDLFPYFWPSSGHISAMPAVRAHAPPPADEANGPPPPPDPQRRAGLVVRSSGQVKGMCPLLGIKLQKFLAAFFTNVPEEEKIDGVWNAQRADSTLRMK